MWLPRLPLLIYIFVLGASAAFGQKAEHDMRKDVARAYAAHVQRVYAKTTEAAEALDHAVRTFLAAPDAAGLEKAKAAWTAARKHYGKTEVFRFYGGPIDSARDGIETYINAWPLDESVIDGTKDQPGSGIIHDIERYPNINATVLKLANGRGGETAITVGWHAIEFLLWGQDLSEDGPGQRSFEDYVDGKGKDAGRRREYLAAVSELLVQHLRHLRDAWAPDAENYRRRFEADSKDAIRSILTGMVVLSGFEMAGERLAVAYETKEQEEEHSCFSDTTHIDFEANQLGIIEVYEGGNADGQPAPGLRVLVERTSAEHAKQLSEALSDTLAKIRAIPVPFDRSIAQPDDHPARKAILAAMEALERQTDLLAALGAIWELDIPLKPGQ